MRLLIDLWVLEEQDSTKKLSLDEETFLKTIWEFVYDKVYHLEQEIDKEEEKETEENPMCIMIEVIRKRLSFNGYSQELRDKLMGCFDENTQQQLNERLEQAFAFLN